MGGGTRRVQDSPSLERKLCNLLATSVSNGSGATLQGLIRDFRTRFARAFMRTINTTRTVCCPQPKE
jgi:hypothetical protein